MILAFLLTVVLASSLFGTTSAQQIVYDSIHNVTAITGTWSSGNKAVLTGLGFANPANMSFNYPATTGISYSFTGDGFYEIARYRFNSNGSRPMCITGVVVWVHGTYTLNSNGSITATPFGDGYQQIQDPCAAVSNFIEVYNFTELYESWRIFSRSSYRTSSPPIPIRWLTPRPSISNINNTKYASYTTAAERNDCGSTFKTLDVAC